MLAQVEPAAADTPFTEICFGNIGHVTGVAGPVGTAIDQQHIERFAIIRELALLILRYEFMGRAVADRTALWRFFAFKDKTADGTSP
jgi:hypothetical protein